MAAKSVTQQIETDGEKHIEEGSGAGSPTIKPDEMDYPDGGLRAWLVVVGAFMTVFCGFGLSAGAGAFQSYYRTSLLSDYSDSEIAWIASAQNFFTFFPAIFAGSLFDRYGHRRLVATGSVSLLLGFLFLSFSTKYYQIILCHGTLIAFGCDLLFICPLAIIGQWFDRRKGLAFGITACGSSVGSVVWPLVLANLPQRVGFGWTCRVLTLIAAICGVCSFFLMKTRFSPAPRDSFFAWGAFRSLQYSLTVANFWFWTFAFISFQLYIGRYCQVLGLGSFAPYLLIIGNGASTLGRLGSGIIADHIGVVNIIIIGNGILAVMLWVWMACTSLASAVVLSIIVGISSGAFVSLQSPFATMTATDPRRGGTMLGQAICLQSFAALIAGPVFGALMREQPTLETFRHGIILAAAMMSAALAFVCAARWRASPVLFSKI